MHPTTHRTPRSGSLLLAVVAILAFTQVAAAQQICWPPSGPSPFPGPGPTPGPGPGPAPGPGPGPGPGGGTTGGGGGGTTPPSQPYTGPVGGGGAPSGVTGGGGGSEPYTGPVGGGGGTSPEPAPPTPDAGGGTTGGGTRGPVGPVRPAGASGSRFATTPRRAKRSAGFSASVQTWWHLNKWRHLALRERLGEADAQSLDGDEYLGAYEGQQTERGGRVGAAMLEQRILPTLRRALRDGEVHARTTALFALGKTGVAEVSIDLMRALRSGKAMDRDAALLGLGLLGAPESVPYLRAIATDAKPGRALLGAAQSRVPASARQFALVALGLTRRADARATLTEAALGEGGETGMVATFALGLGRHDAAIPTLASILDDRKRPPSVRAAAASALGAIGDGSSGVLVRLRAALGEGGSVAASAAAALGRLATAEDLETTNALAEVARGGGAIEPRVMALLSLAALESDIGREVARELMRRSGPLGDFAAIALAIGARGDGRVAAGQDLMRAYSKARGADRRFATLLGLGMLRIQSAEDHLLKVAGGSANPQERQGAVAALGLLRSKAAGPLMSRLAADDAAPAVVRHEAALGLVLCGEPRAAVRELSELMAKSESNYTSAAVALALGLAGRDAAADSLCGLAVSPEANAVVRTNAIAALGIMADESMIPVLYEARAHQPFSLSSPVLRRLFTAL